FGVTTTTPQFSENPFQFTGREKDDITGLYYYRARYYSATLQRFISEDPIGLIAGTNVYLYAGGNPISRFDPTGLDWVYSQSTGALYHPLFPLPLPPSYLPYLPSSLSREAGRGFSGNGPGLNNTVAQSRGSIGPIPQGSWTIGPQQDFYNPD